MHAPFIARPADYRTAPHDIGCAVQSGLACDCRDIGSGADLTLAAVQPAPAILHDYRTGEPLRPATADEQAASEYAAAHKDAGQGVIDVDGRPCYVSGP